MEKKMTTQLLTESARNINGAVVPGLLGQRLSCGAYLRFSLRRNSAFNIHTSISSSLESYMCNASWQPWILAIR